MTDTVLFYWRPGCPFCMALRRGLRRTGVPFREINIWDDPEAAATVRSVANGNETVPTVLIGSRALVNPSVKRVLATVREEAPELLPAEPPRRRWFGRRAHA